ncbi:MAG: phage minor capsid protein [Oscillospiraceae bacterium]|nr:phage minor capsid protein [Oscillospiraceae bacterium]
MFLKAEEQIIAAIGYKRSKGYVDYSEYAALERVQKILQQMVDDSWKYAPKAIEKQYQLGKIREVGYQNAQVMTSTDISFIQRLTLNLMGTLTESAATANRNISEEWNKAQAVGRLNPDKFRESVLEGLTQGEASGNGIKTAKAVFLENMKEHGITAFTDKSGKDWSLRAYADMATRTTSRQAANLGVLFADSEHDLYKISSHGTTCPICAPLEGRVYSRSGTSPYYPPLALAFGKIDPNGGNGLENTYLNIHPNCLHVLIKYTEAGRTEEEVEKTRKFSSFEENPRSVDPRSQAQIDAYRKKEQGRAKLLNDYEQFERYKMTLGGNNGMPKTFQTFQKHKYGDSEKYQEWQSAYRRINREIKQQTP